MPAVVASTSPRFSPRLAFRHLILSDMGELFDGIGETSATFRTMRSFVREHLFNLTNGKTGVWAVVRRDDHKLVGFTSIFRRQTSGHAYVGYAIAQAFRRQGFASEAARATVAYGLGLFPTIYATYATVFPDNVGSQRVLTNCGMREVGTMDVLGRTLLRYAVVRESPGLNSVRHAVQAASWQEPKVIGRA